MGDLFLASGIVPTRMEAIDPSLFSAVDEPEAVKDGSSRAEDPSEPRPTDASAGILCAFSEVVSRWFSVMREAIGRERDRQAKFKEGNGLPKSAKIPYQQPALTEYDRAVTSISESVIRALVGDGAADYARDKFRHAIETGDMRAFKIRLIVLKARDSILDPELKSDFSLGADSCIEQAEEKAGCTPDHSPRRLSRAEQARKNRLDAIREAKLARQKAQLELPLVWPTKESPRNEQDVEEAGKLREPETVSVQGHDAAEASVSATGPFSIYCKGGFEDKNSNPQNDQDPVSKDEPFEHRSVVTVTDKNVVSRRKRYCNIQRKVRDYTSVDEILDDIEQQRIVPYSSLEEILDDVSNERLTRAEAILFVAALDRYCPEVTEETSIDSLDALDEEDDLAKDAYGELEAEGVDDENDEEGYGDDGEEEDDEYFQEEGCGTGFSYNPDGFGGCDDEEE